MSHWNFHIANVARKIVKWEILEWFSNCVSLQNPVYALNPGNEVANFLMPSQVFLNSSCCLRYSSYGLVLGAIMLIWVDTFARLKCVTASFCGCCGGGASVTPWALTSQVAWFKPASSLMALLWLDYYSRWCYLTTTTLTPYLWDRWLFFIGWGTGFSCPLGIANFVIGQSWSFDETRYFFFLSSWHSQCLKILPHRVRFYNLFACGKGYNDVEILILDYSGSQNIDLNDTYKYGWTAFVVACKHGHNYNVNGRKMARKFRYLNSNFDVKIQMNFFGDF